MKKSSFSSSFLGSLFKTVEPSNIDKIHSEYLGIISDTIRKVEKNIIKKYRGVLVVWFAMAPKELFEFLFFPDDDNNIVVPMLDKAEVINGKECAIMTQGFILYILEKIVNDSPEYRRATGFAVEHLQPICSFVFGDNSKQLYYWNYFKEEFKNEDSRNISIKYVYQATSLFIPDSYRKKLAIQAWDDDITGKFTFIYGFDNFIDIQKENSLKMLKN